MAYVAPKRRIELDSPGLVWRVEKGEASVVAEPAPEADLPRTSKTLFRVKQGGYVFGISSEGLSDRMQVFIETTPGARLAPMMAEDFIDTCRSKPDVAAEMVSDAVAQLARHVSPDIPPPDVVKMLKPGSNFRLPKGARVSAESELWFSLDTDTARYGGCEALRCLTSKSFHPLAGNMWVELGEKNRLVCVKTEDVIKAGLFFDAFVSFAAMVVEMTFEHFSEMALSKLRRLMESSRHRTEEFAKALNQAASVIDPTVEESANAPNVFEAVSVVCKALGSPIKPPPRLKQDMAGQLEDVLGHNGYYSRDVALSGNWFTENSGPLLGFVSRPHGTEAVALLPGRNGYLMFDPATRTRIPVTKENADEILDTAKQLYQPLPAGKMGPLALTKFSMRGCGRELARVIIMGLLGGVCGFALPMAMSSTVDKVIANGEYGLLGQIVAGLLMIVIGSSIFQLVKSTAMLRAETRAQVALQSAIFGRLLKLRVDFFKKFPAGDLANRAMAVDNIRQSVSGSVLAALLSSTFALTNLVLLAVYSWQLALVVFAILLITLLFTYLVMKGQMKFQTKVQNAIGKLAGMELQLVTGINKLRAAGAETNAFARWMETFSELRKITYAIGRGTNVVTVYSSGLPLFSSFMVFGLFLFSGMYQELPLGSFLCFNSALGQLTSAVSSLAGVAVSLLFIKPMYQRAKPILDAEPETHAALEDPGELMGAVEAVNVTFAYPGSSQPALVQVNFKAEPGEFVAIVGPSGSGKSSLLKLMLGFHQPNAGTILFDGTPLRRLDPIKVRRQIGSVIQNGELIQGNIYFNIMGATGDEDGEAAWEAAKLAAVDKDIQAMPMGMHTFVPHGGGTFSGGQRQRLMIARALSKKPRIFLLDEATSNLDNTSQAEVMTNLNRINATRIVVAHRLSTIRKADRIYVMQQGTVVEVGNFDQLMKKGGLFAKLASRQMD